MTPPSLAGGVAITARVNAVYWFAIFFSLLLSASLVAGFVVSKQPPGVFVPIPILLGLLFLATYRGGWAKVFDAEGIVLFNGKRLPWDTFERVDRLQVRAGHRFVLVFSGGTASVNPFQLANRAEIVRVVEELEARGGRPQ